MLQRAIRAHGNFTEYVPTMLMLLFLLERSGVADMKLHALAAAFFVGRVMHGICMGFMRSSMPLRVGGTALTLLHWPQRPSPCSCKPFRGRGLA